jgi:hypothetical protein
MRDFKSSEEVQKEITDLCTQIMMLQSKLPDLRKQLQLAEKIEAKIVILESINHLGARLTKARWTEQQSSLFREYNPYTKQDEHAVEKYELKLKHKETELIAKLFRFSDNYALEYSLSQYGTSIRADDFAGDTIAEAKVWAKGELEQKLMRIKKQLLKDLKPYI